MIDRFTVYEIQESKGQSLLFKNLVYLLDKVESMFSPTLDSLDNLCTMYFTNDKICFALYKNSTATGPRPPVLKFLDPSLFIPQLRCAWSIGSIYMYLWIDLIERLYLYNESSLGVLFPKLIHTQIRMKLLDNVDLSHCEN